MSNPTPEELLSSLQSSVLTIQKLKARLAAAEEPIAVVGMGCRLPGQVADPDSFWQLLTEGLDVVTEVPATRWLIDDFYDPVPDTPGKTNTRCGAFLTAVELFDPQFFGISPREAVGMDPQQRLLLEVAWEAVERAGLVWDRLQGEPTGIFIGISGNDYAELVKREVAADTVLEAYSITGNTLNAAAGRISYLLGLHGPSLAVDTACSSSLVAVHLACQSLRARECRTALAGGVNLILTPSSFVALSQSHALAADGRCKVFAANADGYGRGEGCGIVVLKRLSDAVHNGDPILAILRGSAVNQDGASSGLTVPNGLAQQALIRQALANAKIEPDAVAYVEAHGTGTPLGDPIEVEALDAVFGRRQIPLVVGSAKANLGHLEAAAGVIGLIKVILSLQHRYIPPQIHCSPFNPQIAWERVSVQIPTVGMTWPGERRVAGVSSFGLTGTNAHIVVEAAPTLPGAQTERPLHILTISAKSTSALADLAVSYVRFLERTPEPLADIAFSANSGRRHFSHRLAVVAASSAEASTKLAAWSADASAFGVYNGESLRSQPASVALLFTGQGAQYVNMARQLYTTQPTFRVILERCAATLHDQLGLSLLSLLYPEEGAASSSLLHETISTQPALFALEYALAELWRSWGIEPAALLGHSLGEYVAACVAGVFSLEEGMQLVAERARLMQSLPQQGKMVAVFAPVTRVETALRGHEQDVAIAAINGPQHTVISGRTAAVTAIAAALAAEGIETQVLNVSHAFHSPLVEPMLGPLASLASKLTMRSPRIPLVSNQTGALLAPDWTPDPAYWCRQTRETVHFMAGVQTLQKGGHILLEIGPKPVLTALARQSAPNALCLPSLNQGRGDWETMLNSLAALYTQGVKIDWHAFDREAPLRRLSLPTYPFQRKRYWLHERELLMSNQTQGTLARPGTGSRTELDAGSLNGAANRPERRAQLQKELVGLMASTLQLSPSEIGGEVPFLEMGADSIVLANAVHQIEQKYGVKLTMRQFFGELTTIAALAEYLDVQLPPATFEREVEQAGAVELAPESHPHRGSAIPTVGGVNRTEPVAGGDGALERILRDQLAVMAQQLELLAGSQPRQASLAAPAVSAPTVSAPAVSVPAVSVPAVSEVFAAWKKPQIQGVQLTARQQQHLALLVERYTRRTRTSKELTQASRHVLADNRASAGFRPSIKEMLYPLMGERAEGAFFWDVDGNRYLDITMGFGVLLFGHTPAFVAEAVAAQLQKGLGIGPTTQMAGEVARLVCELTGMERVTFCNSGTEAVMTALRLARAKTRRSKIVYFSGSYHGHAESTLGIAEAGNEKPGAVTIFPGIPQNFLADALVLEYGNPQSLEVIRGCAQELAAVLVEPVQSRRPDLQPAEFLRQLRTLTDATGVTLIFDETITGFRIHPGGAQAWFGVAADIATYGKIVGGGLPIGLVAGRSAWMDCIDGGFWRYGDGSYPTVETTFFAGTFMKHPLTMAAACAVLLRLKADGSTLYATLNRRTARLVNTLNDWFQAEEVPIHLVQFGSLFRFVFKNNLDLFFYHLLERGIFVWEGRNCFLSVAHTDDDVDMLIEAVKESVGELRAGGFLPESTAVQPALVEPVVLHTLPLNAAQQQLWVLAQLSEAGAVAYQDCVCIELQGHLRVDWLQRSLQQMVDRHEALRTTLDGNGQEQHIWRHWQVELPLIDFFPLPESERRQALSAWLQEEIQHPLNLATGPVLGTALLRLAPEQHILVLRAHHAFSDGWSWSILVQELGHFYAGLGKGALPRLDPPLQFREYLAWQSQQKESPAMAEHEAYWLAQLAEPLPVVELPADRPRPTTTHFGGGRVVWQLERQLADAVKRLARKQGSTLFMTLFSVFSAFLHRVTAQEDLVIGIPVGGRFLAGSETMVGYGTHLLPIRSRLDASIPFTAYLEQMRSQLLNGFEHQEYPFAWLYEKLNAQSARSRLPAITVTFNLDRPLSLPQMAELQATLFAPPHTATAFDLAVNVLEANDDLNCSWDYSTELFDRETVERLIHYFQTWLAAVVATPGEAVTRLPLLRPAEQQQIQVEWNATQADYPQHCIHELFEAQVASNPEGIALIQGEQRVTLRALNDAANCLAHHLIACGVGRASTVGLMAERSPEMVAGLLAILKAGAAYLPLDPMIPTERLLYVLANTGAELLLTQRPLVDRVPEGTLPCLMLEEILRTARFSGVGNPALPATPDQLAYVLYTSGSTGQPKGVEAPHRGAVNRFHWMWRTYPFVPGEVCCQKTALSFADSVWEIFGPLLRGVPSLLIPDQVVKEPRLLVEQLAEHAVSRIVLVPSLLRTLLDSIPDLQQRLPELRIWVCSGEALSFELCEKFYAQMPEARLLNLYGSSEVAADVTCYDTRVGGLRQGVQGLPIGRPIDNTQIYLLDRYGQIVPVGIPGDLYVGGAGLARGYRGQPQLTAESFVPNPFAKPGRAERLYRMGDRARYLSEGTLEYLGRQDFQVKIRGFRVELGEVEAALRACPDVGQALVVARAETTGDNQLVAYLVPQNQTVEPAKLDIGAIRRCVMQKLPAYMVPALYVPLAMFPLTASGKVNRRALPPPEAATYRSETVYVAPRTATEETLVSIWGDVLELSPAGIGVYDNFGDLGGHSLRAVQVMNRIQEQLLVSLPFDQLFVQQTVAALAERVEIELLAQQGDEEMLQLLAEFGETSELGTDKEGNGR